MPAAPLPPDETARIAALHRAKILDTNPERTFDDLVVLAAQVCDTPISLVSLVDTDRQWFKARFGLDATQTPRDWAFCAHAISEDEVLVVPDATLDARFSDNPLVLDAPNIRFYAGAPLSSPDGHRLGTLCVIDRVPRDLTAEQEAALGLISRLAEDQLAMRENLDELSQLMGEVRTLREIIPICAWCKQVRDDEGFWSAVDQYLEERADVDVTHGICPGCADTAREEIGTRPS